MKSQHPMEPTPQSPVESTEATEPFDVDRKWQIIKARFVDDPAGAVREAEQLVGAIVDRWIHRVRAECDSVRQAGARDGNEPSTEQLRMSLQRYEAFIERMAEGSNVH